MKDYRSYALILSSWENKAWKNSGLKEIPTNDHCDNGAVLLLTELSEANWELVTLWVLKMLFRSSNIWNSIYWLYHKRFMLFRCSPVRQSSCTKWFRCRRGLHGSCFACTSALRLGRYVDVWSILKSSGSKYVSGKLPTYPSTKLTFCSRRELSANVRFEEGLGGHGNLHWRTWLVVAVDCCTWWSHASITFGFIDWRTIIWSATFSIRYFRT